MIKNNLFLRWVITHVLFGIVSVHADVVSFDMKSCKQPAKERGFRLTAFGQAVLKSILFLLFHRCICTIIIIHFEK